MRKLIAFVLMLAMGVIFCPILHPKAEANTNYNVTVFVANKQVDFPDQKPFIDEDVGRTYVPVRFVSEALGATVNWDSVTQAVYIEKPQLKVVLTIGSNEADVNSVKKTLDAPAVLVGDRTMVPLRFVSEALGEGVKWTPGDSASRVDISMSDSVMVPAEPEMVKFIDTLLSSSKMKSIDNSSWTAEEGGIYYHLYNANGEGTGYSRAVITVDVNNASDLSNLRKIAAHYFPEKFDEIYLAVRDRYDKFKNNKIEVKEYSISGLNDRKLFVKAFNVGSDRYVSMEIVQVIL